MTPPFRFSTLHLLFLFAVLLGFQFFAVKLWDNENLWKNEMKAYYAYLPALFVLHDVALEKTEMVPPHSERFYFPQPAPKRGHVIKTTMGVAVMQAPFFLAGHWIAQAKPGTADGYSEPYRIMIAVSALVYCLGGLFFVRKTLRLFFSEAATALTLITLMMGTNLYFYALYEGSMTHVYSFFLVAVFVYYTVAWHRNPGWQKMVLLGFVLGLITLIRPVNVCLGIFFLFYRDAAQASLREKFVLLLAHLKWVALAGVCAFLALLPQLAYWKYVSGSWLFYSYGDEPFFWFRPKILLGLFSYQKGWLVWTPVMWFALVGILLLRKETKAFRWPVLLSLALYIYVIFSWWCWWYGGSYGMRPMVDVMAILALPLAAFFRQILRSRLVASPVLGLWLFLVLLNQFQIHQYTVGKLHWAGVTKKIYWQLFLNDYPREDYSRYLVDPNVEEAKRGETGID